ncbi:unnamed protein product [Symbiodinium microadriaticum]|nr:unnamed protein product [Symbiodinium microadriaticum]CAE7826923.1 unnamed protein product [Symbiodinium sp. KB8]
MASPQNKMLDDAIAKYAAKADSSECIRLSDLEKHVCRRDLPKTCVLVLDAHYQISEFGNLLSACERLSNQDYSALPPRLQPTTSLPHGSTVSYIIHNLQDGTMDVLRIIRFAAKVAAKEATGFCTGLPLFFAYREGPWSWKKAVHALLGRLPGHHVVWWTLCQKELKRSQSTAWTAPDDELVKGVDFVNKNAQDDDSENQQYLWILTNVKPDSGSPIGRYHINRLELEDFLMGGDVKSWLTSEEDQNCSGRYTDVKLVANGLRALAANDFVPEDEPLPDKHHTSIDPKEFFKLVRKFFDGYKEAAMMAVLKRCILFIFGKRATYLRLPSPDRNAIIRCVRLDDLHEDLFTPRDKDFYAKYKVGIHEPPPTFEADVAKEQELLLQGIESMQTAGRPETYLADINQKIANELGSLTRTSTAVHLPASPSTDEENAVPVPFPEALPVAYVNPPGRIGQFQYPPPKRRLTSKTSMTSETVETLETPTHIAGGRGIFVVDDPSNEGQTFVQRLYERTDKNVKAILIGGEAIANVQTSSKAYAVARRSPSVSMQFNLGEPASHIVKLSKVLTFPPTQPVNAISFDGHVGLHRNLSKCDPPRTVRLKVKGHPRKLKLLRDDERSCSCKRKDMGRAALLQRTAGWQFAVDPDSRRVLGAVEHLQNECNADKITLLKPVMNMQNVTANLLIHDDMCHFESFAKKHHAKLVSGIRHFVVDAFHCPNHTCQKQDNTVYLKELEGAAAPVRSLEPKNVVTNGDFNSGTRGWKEYKQINKRAGMHLHKIGNKHALHLHGSCDITGGGVMQEVTTIPDRSYTIKWEPLTGPWDGARSSKEANMKIIFGDLDKTLKVEKPGKPHIRWTGSSLILDKKPAAWTQ